MIQAISANNPIYFKQTHSKKSSEQSKKDENPISRKGEAMKLVAATFVGGLALAGRLILELAEGGDFILESIAKKAEKIAKKSGKNVNDKEVMKEAKKQVQKRRELNTIGAFVGLLAAFFAGVAILYTVFNAPKIAYESKVNSYKKSKEMDVYVKANEAERELYTQLDEKAKMSNKDEKSQLKEQYLKMKNAKNQVPEFVNLKLK